MQWLLIRRKLSQTAAARQVGVTQATIANIISGARKPSAETLMKLARGLDSSPSFIMYGTGFQLSYAEPENDVQAELLKIHKTLCETEQEMLIVFARTLARRPVIATPSKRRTKPHLEPLQDT